MKYTEEMILHSESGYSMPFEEPQGKDVELSLGYGEQADPATGEKFFHHGIDFNIRCYMLSAIASGIVSGVGNDPAHGICQTIRYGEYEVTYGHLSNVFAQFGQRVKAGQTVALSGDRLHLEVRFKGEELNPIEFLTMLYGNIRAMRQAAGRDTAGFSDLEMTLQTDYEKDKREIEELMLRFLPHYMEDLQRGAYTLPGHTEQSLRNIFTMGAMKEYFYERMPSMANPLGLGHKAMPLACKVQNLLIGDFLNYLAMRHEVCLPTVDGSGVKKNFMTKP
ncbi:M23 family metallopeptidase [uncultured Bacteroides sp.]|uniref:M23 family metallopeptidase n=1 Tax=uncultured Bacteroides sp. TaxID=162156 RepID=UPI002606BCB4|nr:M23 family metallopeptidase [uncultured Bacteroides sp.]